MKIIGKIRDNLLIVGPHCFLLLLGPCFIIGFSMVTAIVGLFCIAIAPGLPFHLSFMAYFLSIQPIAAYILTAVKNPGVATL